MNAKGHMESSEAVGNNGQASYGPNENSIQRKKAASILIRLATAPLCAIALILMVTDKEIRHFFIPTSPPIVIDKTAKYTAAKVLVFYVYVNGVVAGYLLLHAIFSVLTFLQTRFRFQLWLTFILDQLMAYVLLAAAAATTEVGYISKRGQVATNWEQTCNVFGKFCIRGGASIFVCFIGILALTVLAALSAHQLFSSSASRPSTRKMATTIAAPKNFGRN